MKTSIQNLAYDLVRKPDFSGLIIHKASIVNNIPQNELARMCYIMVSRKREEESILQDLRIESSPEYTKDPEELDEDDIKIFPEIVFNLEF